MTRDSESKKDELTTSESLADLDAASAANADADGIITDGAGTADDETSDTETVREHALSSNESIEDTTAVDTGNLGDETPENSASGDDATCPSQRDNPAVWHIRQARGRTGIVLTMDLVAADGFMHSLATEAARRTGIDHASRVTADVFPQCMPLAERNCRDTAAMHSTMASITEKVVETSMSTNRTPPQDSRHNQASTDPAMPTPSAAEHPSNAIFLALATGTLARLAHHVIASFYYALYILRHCGCPQCTSNAIALLSSISLLAAFVLRYGNRVTSLLSHDIQRGWQRSELASMAQSRVRVPLLWWALACALAVPHVVAFASWVFGTRAAEVVNLVSDTVISSRLPLVNLAKDVQRIGVRAMPLRVAVGAAVVPVMRFFYEVWMAVGVIVAVVLLICVLQAALNWRAWREGI